MSAFFVIKGLYDHLWFSHTTHSIWTFSIPSVYAYPATYVCANSATYDILGNGLAINNM